MLRAPTIRVQPSCHAGKPTSGTGESAVRLRTPTLADEAANATQSARSGGLLSLKARAAVTLAGQHADAIAWFADSGVFISSSRYDAAPAVADFVKRHLVEERLGAVWDLTLPRQSYIDDDSTRGVTTKTFQPGLPHALKGQARQARSVVLRPLANESVLRRISCTAGARCQRPLEAWASQHHRLSCDRLLGAG